MKSCFKYTFFLVIASVVFSYADNTKNKAVIIASDAKQAAEFVKKLAKKKKYAAYAVAAKMPKQQPKYIAELEKYAKKNSQWARKFNKKITDGFPIPFDKLVSSQKIYNSYLAYWAKRQIVKINKKALHLMLQPIAKKQTEVTITELPQFNLVYHADGNYFQSINGKLQLGRKVSYDKSYIFGALEGWVWEFKSKDNFSVLKEEIILLQDKSKHGYLFYSLIEFSAGSKKIIANDTLVLQFPLNKK